MTIKKSTWHSGSTETVCRAEVTDRQTDMGSYSSQAENRVPKWEKNENVNINTPMSNPLSHFCSIHRGLPFTCNHKDSEESERLLARSYPPPLTCFICKNNEKINITGSSFSLASTVCYFQSSVYRVCRRSAE